MMLRSLVYCSRAAAPWLQDDLAALLAQARAHNAEHGITGRLVFTGRTFVQVLEGPPGAVGLLFASIARDPRHRGLTVLTDRRVDAREFAAWSMDFAAAATLSGAERARIDLALKADSGRADSRGVAATPSPAATPAPAATPVPVPRRPAALRHSPQQRRSQATVERIVAAAWDILRTEGLGAVSLARAAQGAGITRASAYRYFGALDELFAAMTTEWHGRALQCWVASLNRAPPASADHLAERVAAFLTPEFLLPPFLTAAAQRTMLGRGLSEATLAALCLHVRNALDRANLPQAAALDDASLGTVLGGMADVACGVARRDPAALASHGLRTALSGQFLGALQAAGPAAVAAG